VKPAADCFRRIVSVTLDAAVFPLAQGSDRLQISPPLARIVDPDLSTAVTQFVVQLRLGF
jgi:hypothetical protein